MKKNTLNHVLVDASIAILAGLAIVATLGATGSALTGALTQKCGDGIKQGKEQCDDGNTYSGDACSMNCKVEPGWGIECKVDSKTHLTVCKRTCGDGVKGSGEDCDDGNAESGDGCSVCRLDEGYICNNDRPNRCRACGDGVKNSGEQCDDWNRDSGDGCSETCNLEPGFKCTTDSRTRRIACVRTCGDGVKAVNEQCDDRNGNGGDGCNGNCALESGFNCSTNNRTHLTVCEGICGNGKTQENEQCDDGNLKDGDGCSSACHTEEGYSCNNGYQPTKCKSSICGNGKVEGYESCDDGNTKNNDGCSSVCEFEVGFNCFLPDPSTRCERNNCGNGKRDEGEQCDDGNLRNNDGCDQDCNVLDYFQCSESSPNVCYQCGNGKREGTEECDDGNNSTHDRCGEFCNIENDLIKKDIGIHGFITSSYMAGCNDNIRMERFGSCSQYEAQYVFGSVQVQYHLDPLSNQQFIEYLPTDGKPLQDGNRITEIKEFEGRKYVIETERSHVRVSWYKGHRDIVIEMELSDLGDDYDTKVAYDLVHAYLRKHGSDLQIQTTSALPKP